MAELSINGRMSVKTLKKRFLEEFGAHLRVYNGAKFADDNATLASLRKTDAQSKGGDLKINLNMQVGTLEKRIKEIFGIRVQVANSDGKQLLENSITLGEVVRIHREMGLIK